MRQIVERLDALSDHDELSLAEIIEAFGRNSFLPMLLIPALLVVSPLSGIPLFSTVCGLLIAAIALQRVARRAQVWLPGFLTRRTISGTSLHRATWAMRRIADWLDRNSAVRLEFLVTPPFSIGALMICALAGLAMPMLELVPFSSSLLGVMVTLIAVGLLVRDGVFVILATVFAALAVAVPTFVVSQVVN